MTHTETAPARLAIVIVTWNVRDLILDCLHSVFADLVVTDLQSEVWVVDNDSTDGTAEAIRAAFPPQDYPSLHLIEVEENLGFAAGNNLALRALGFPDGDQTPDYVFLLNADTTLEPGTISALVAGLESSGAGLAGAKLVYGDGSFQHSAFAFPGLAQLAFDLFPLPARLCDSRLNGRYSRALYAQDQPFEIGFPLGATWLLRRDVIAQTGLFDEQFYLYCEEIDWAIRIHEAGSKIVCVPSAQVTHYAGQSTSQNRPASLVKLWKARLQFYRKHYPPFKRFLATLIVRAGMNHQIQATARDSTLDDDLRRELVQAYWEVIRLSRGTS